MDHLMSKQNPVLITIGVGVMCVVLGGIGKDAFTGAMATVTRDQMEEHVEKQIDGLPYPWLEDRKHVHTFLESQTMLNEKMTDRIENLTLTTNVHGVKIDNVQKTIDELKGRHEGVSP